MPLHIMAFGEPVGTQHSLADEADFDARIGDEEFGHRSFDGARLIRLGEPGGAV